MAMMGIWIIIGIVQAFVFVTLMQIGQYFFIHGGMFGRIGKQDITTAKTTIHWDDVIGMESAKKEAGEIVKLLRDRHLLKVIGGKIGGRVLVKKALVPLVEGALEIPPITVSYFSPASGSYKTVTAGPYMLDVLPAQDAEKFKVVEAAG